MNPFVTAAGALRGIEAAGDLVLLVDQCHTMRVWEHTVESFTDAVRDEGIFTDVKTRPLGSPPDPQCADSLALMVSDCLGEVWRRRSTFAMIRRWATAMPMALINPFPQEHWYRGSVVPRYVGLSARQPLAVNGDLLTCVSEKAGGLFDEPLSPNDIAIPMLELDSRWLGWWARLLAGTEGIWLDAMAFVVGDDPPPAEPGDPSPDPRQAVARFRAEATPLAFELATYAAAAPLTLEVLRALREEMLPEAQTVHLAEVITSRWLMEPCADLTFRTGVREALLAHATRADSAAVVDVLYRRFRDRRPSIQGLYQALSTPDERRDVQVNPQTLPFARYELALMRALSGPYARRARRLSQAIDEHLLPPAPDDESGGTVVTTPATNPETPVGGPAIAPTETPGRETIWGNVPTRNGDFTGRTELLDLIEEQMRSEPVTAVLPHALHGMGGVGKSQIATEYAYRHRPDYDVIWWISAEQPSQIRRALIDLGSRLGLDVSMEANTAVQVVREALRAGAPYQNWLLIFDNAETLDTVRPYLPEGGTGKVLVTSRNPEWTRLADTVEIDVFTRAESIELLRRRNPDLTVTEANEMAEALGDLPLAVDQASAWRAITGMPVTQYLRLLADKRDELAGQEAPAGYEMPVAVAWNVALDRLGTENPAALQLLQVCSFFAPEPILLELFTSPRIAPISPELDRTLQNPSRLNRALRDIQKYRLARIDHRGSPAIHLHRLVRTVLQSRLSATQRSEMEHGAHILLAGGNPGGPDKATQWQRYHALLPHAVSSNAAGCDDPWARQLVLHSIEFLYYSGDYTECRDLARQVVDAWRRNPGADDPQTLKAAKWLGYVLWLLGEFAEAAEINRDSLARLQRTADQDDEEITDAMSMVAGDLRAAGDFQEARDLSRRAYETCLSTFGEEDPATLQAAHALGVALRLTGEFREAFELDSMTYARRGRVLGEDHALTLLTLNGRILDLRECGQYPQAHREQEELYERHQRILGTNHPNTIAVARNLAVARRRAGRHDEARKLAHDTMNLLRDVVGPRHRDTIAATLNYAVDVRENDQLESSLALAEQAYHDYETVFGSEHPFTLYARTNLAIVLRLLGDPEASFSHNTIAFEMLRQRLGSDHVLTLTCATNLASDHAELGRFEVARSLDEDTLARSREVLGEEHPSTVALELNLSFDLADLGRIEESTRLYEKALASYRRVLGEDHPAIRAAQARVRANCDVDPMPL